MSDASAQSLERLSLDDILAGIERQQAETRKFVAEQTRLSAEQRKLVAESFRLNRDRLLAPFIAVSSTVGAVAALQPSRP